MDSFEDFEFKPLTEGLGFHKKNPTTKAAPLPPLEPKNELKTRLGNALENIHTNSLKFETPKFEEPTAHAPVAQPAKSEKFELPELAPTPSIFSKPLPRTEKDVERKEATPVEIPKFKPNIGRPLANPAIRDSKIQEAGILSVLEGKSPAAAVATPVTEQAKPNKVDTTVEVVYAETAPAALALFLDFTVIMGLSILFMLGLVVATGLDLMPILNSASQDTGTQIGVALLVYSVSQLYLILVRSFYGQTLGEWSMDMQLGLPKDQEKAIYALKLIARTLLLAATGFILLPIASMLMGQDLTGRAVNLKLYKK